MGLIDQKRILLYNMFMKLFKKQPERNIDLTVDLRSFRFLGEEAEVLGKRLDAARDSLPRSQTPWAKSYWKSCVDRLTFQWRQLPVLHDADAKMSIIPRWVIDYEFYETGRPTEYVGITERAYDKLFRESVNLDASWENHRAKRLARCQ